MSRKSLPKYRKQTRPNGKYLAFVEIGGIRRYLGSYGSKESKQEYARLIAEWETSDRQLHVNPDEIIIVELAARFLKHAENYYKNPNTDVTSEVDAFKDVLRLLVRLYGSTRAVEFGPLRLRTVRDEMIKVGWCRTYINRQVSRLKSIWRWGVTEELVPASTYEALRAIPGLKFGRTKARESDPVEAVSDGIVDKTLPHMSPTLQTMVSLQRLTGMRSGELCRMRTGDMDMSGDVWIYSPIQHKTRYRGRKKLIYLGPKCQELLSSYLKHNLQESIFSPRQSESERREMMHEKRETPMSCGNKPGSNRKRHPKWEPGTRYNPGSYARAIKHACRQAFPAPEGTTCKAIKAWRRNHQWSPNRLRHSFATEIRREHGLEAAQVLLGHARADVSQVYAERDFLKARDVALAVG